jgi:hypothetical protein
MTVSATCCGLILHKATVAKRDAFRIDIILNGADGLSHEYSARQLDTDVEPVKKWRKRWLAAHAELLTFEQGFDGHPATDTQLLRRLLSVLADTPRSGRLKTITVEQEQQLGVKGVRGILKSQVSRMKFLQRNEHSIRFVFTPKHCSWLNPIENWFARLSRAALKGRSLSSLDELQQCIVNYIDYYNGCLAKAFNRLSDGFAEDRPLAQLRR